MLDGGLYIFIPAVNPGEGRLMVQRFGVCSFGLVRYTGLRYSLWYHVATADVWCMFVVQVLIQFTVAFSGAVFRCF